MNSLKIILIWLFYKPVYLVYLFGRLLVSHAKVCLTAFDPIHDAPSSVSVPNLAEYRQNLATEKDRQIRRLFILPICVWLYVAVDTLWVLWQNDFDYFNRPLSQLITHRLYARKFWQQCDMQVLLVGTGSCLTALILLCNTWLNDRFCMYFVGGHGHLIVNGKVWNRKNSQKLYKFRLQSKKIVQSMGIFSFLFAYQHFRSINTHLAYQCAEIRGYNHFWAAPVSVMFCVNTLVFGYLLYSMIFRDKSLDQYLHFGFFLLEVGAFVYLAILLASLIDRNNDRFYERNMKACVAFELYFKTDQSSILWLININKIATNRNFTKCCFRLANGYRLDSTAFDMTIFIMSTFFLFICKQNAKQSHQSTWS